MTNKLFTTIFSEIKVGSIVTRKLVWYNDFRNGEVVEIIDDRCKIKWDEKRQTGQQHSTINKKFLNLIKA